jgi:hypothetical protein
LKPAVRRANQVDHITGGQISLRARYINRGDQRKRHRADRCEYGSESATYHKAPAENNHEETKKTKKEQKKVFALFVSSVA